MFMPSTHAARHSARAGFSIVEMLVALMLLALGLLGVAGTAISIARLQRSGASRSLAAAMAESRLELVRHTRCIPPSGDTTVGTLVERWHVVPLSGSMHELIDSVSISGAAHDARHTEVFRSAVRC